MSDLPCRLSYVLHRCDERLWRDGVLHTVLLELGLQISLRLDLHRSVELVDLGVGEILNPLLIQGIDFVVAELHLRLLAAR